ncbi:hypothetical protein JA1_000279 [Spathaspora sp. JA1]|nr:hypothetical protein JA1_000279 [Spathaspora sp. JA1]
METSSEISPMVVSEGKFLDEKSSNRALPSVPPPRYHPFRSTSLVHNLKTTQLNTYISKRQMSMGQVLFPHPSNQPVTAGGVTSAGACGKGSAAEGGYFCVTPYHAGSSPTSAIGAVPFQPPFYNSIANNVNDFTSLNPRKDPNMNFREKIMKWLETIPQPSEDDDVICYVGCIDSSFSQSGSEAEDEFDIDIGDLEDRLEFQAEKLTKLTTRQYRYDSEAVALYEEYSRDDYPDESYARDDSYQVLIHPNY